MSTLQSADRDQQELTEPDLEARVTALENDIRTLTAAIDAASRLRIATRLRINHDTRIAGGKNCRRILDTGGLVRGYSGAPGTE